MSGTSTPERSVDYHSLRQPVFEHSLLFMEGILGRKGSLIDLGAGHCMFSRMAHSMGWGVTALDVRTARVPDLPAEITFINADVTSDVWTATDYDLILCLGLYYHLDQDMQHKLLLRCRGKPLILDTHFANLSGVPTKYGALTETHTKNGEVGADYHEASGLSDEQRKAKSLLASFDNPTSWWQTRESLIDTLHDYGWPHVWTFDYAGINEFQRTFFICHALDLEGETPSGIRFSQSPIVSRVAPRRRTARSEES
jgi:hypothetical protein